MAFENITERKKAQEALKRSEEKFRELVRQSPFSIQIVKPDGHIEEVNQAFKDLWGIPEEDLPVVLPTEVAFEGVGSPIKKMP